MKARRQAAHPRARRARADPQPGAAPGAAQGARDRRHAGHAVAGHQGSGAGQAGGRRRLPAPGGRRTPAVRPTPAPCCRRAVAGSLRDVRRRPAARGAADRAGQAQPLASRSTARGWPRSSARSRRRHDPGDLRATPRTAQARRAIGSKRIRRSKAVQGSRAWNESFWRTPAGSTRRWRSRGWRRSTTPRSIAVTLDLGQGARARRDVARARARRRRRARARARRARRVRARLHPAGAAGGRDLRGRVSAGHRAGAAAHRAKLVEIAHMESATAVAHGCTGKGNDQVRLDARRRARSTRRSG